MGTKGLEGFTNKGEIITHHLLVLSINYSYTYLPVVFLELLRNAGEEEMGLESLSKGRRSIHLLMKHLQNEPQCILQHFDPIH
jgi:hypothetical protein